MGRKRFLILGVAVIAFLVGLASVYLLVRNHTRLESNDQVGVGALPKLDYCEVRNDPDKYSGKFVRIEADMYWFMHGTYLFDANCADPAGGTLMDEARTAVRFNRERSASIDAKLPPKTRRRDWEDHYRIVAVGRFTHQRPESQSDLIDDRTSFHFEIYSIESAELRHP